MPASSPSTLPAGHVSVNVAFVSNALLSGLLMSRFSKPNIRGMETLQPIPSSSYFIEHPSGRRLMFDLGPRKDLENLSPMLSKRMAKGGWQAEITQEVPEALQQHGIPIESIENVIWSHWHWDHVGNMSKLPQSIGLVVGPGFTKAMVPGYPENPSSPILESDYSGRMLIELNDFGLTVGGLPAYDYFGDGSLYILSTPGHATGHLSALARTSEGANSPFAGISDHLNGESAASDPATAMASLQMLQQLDKDNGNVFFTVAHDKFLLEVVGLFPKWANEWRSRDWAKQARWLFLRDLAEEKGLITANT
ncbi:metallo-beta-lactamase superfamily protein [Trichoderma gamsii]|uniref:Metallo-beta-lactamase superfamily protein n=1 Tax=Trichoderma gamsii TaxID=398673 RepID=A0A2P4Z6U4_9HYPO|nr:metallo-beta-lactamase superfamily protein [Trichoderma gamsii]PON20006.1 metallo-beta-lactamase superfamily protein [Trichoderma gamsii]